MSKLHLKPNPTLKDLQAYVDQAMLERGFDKESLAEVFLVFSEECGELAKVVRKNQNIKMSTDSALSTANSESADVLFMLLCVCKHLGVDLEQAFRYKEEVNKKRTWK